MYCTSFLRESKGRFAYPITLQNLSCFCLIFRINTSYTSWCLFRTRISISRFLQKFMRTNSKNSWYKSSRLSWLTITIYPSLWSYRLSISEILSRERFGFRKIHCFTIISMISARRNGYENSQVIQEPWYWDRFIELYEVNLTPWVFPTSSQIIVFLAILIFLSVDMKSLALALGIPG